MLKKYKNTYPRKLYSDYEKKFVQPNEEFINEETPKMRSLLSNGYVKDLGIYEIKKEVETKLEAKPVQKGRKSKKSKRESKFKKKYEEVI